MTNAGEAYPYRSHAIGPNFVTVKLSCKIKYNLWRMQMECLIKSQHMVGFIDGQSPRPARNGKGKGKVEDMEAWDASDSLVKCWILCSISQEAVNAVVNHLTYMQNNTDVTAKDLWDGLQRICGLSEASTSNPSFIADVGEAYPYPSVIGPNFVTMKLSGKDTYNVWDTHILCLLKSYHMYLFINGQFPRPAGNGKGEVEGMEAWDASDSLVKCWILGTLCDEVAKKVVNRLRTKDKKTDFSAKDLWDGLQRIYRPSKAPTSNPSFIVDDVGEAYPYPSVIGFVTMKLSGKDTYNVWETHIICLIKNHHMYGFIDGQFPRPAGNGNEKEGDMEAWDASDSLVKCWILGSLSEEAVNTVVNHLTHMQNNTDFTAKDLWDGLQRIYGPSEASTSNPSIIVNVGEAYPYPSLIAPNIVTVKLSGKNKYNMWKTQMLCLLKSHQMYGFIDGQFPRPAGNEKGNVGDLEAWIISDSLVKGWIIGSLSEESVNTVVNHLTHMQNNTDFTAKDLWDGLQSIYDPLAASSSNPSFIVDVGEAYPYPSSVTGPNFITMKLSGKDTYSVWETQILSLLWSQHMVGFIEGEFPSPAGNGKRKVGDIDAWIAADSLVKGWILGSLSDEVTKKVVNRLKTIHKNTYFTAKDLWDQLQHSYGPSGHKQASDSLVKGRILGLLSDGVAKRVVNRLKHKHENADFTAKDVWAELQRSYETKLRTRQADSEVITESESEIKATTESETEIEGKASNDLKGFQFRHRTLYEDVIQGNTRDVIAYLDTGDDSLINPWGHFTNNGDTVLHVAVGSSTKNHELLNKLLELTPTEKLLEIINLDGSTTLHVAAIGGNTEVVDILVERNPELLFAKDKEGHTPLALSISNMHIKTSHCLFEHMKVHRRHMVEEKEKEYDALFTGDLNTSKCWEDIDTSGCLLEQTKKKYDALFTGKSGEELVVLAISCQDFSLAYMIIDDYGDDGLRSNSEAVLTALAQNFPRELHFWEPRASVYQDVSGWWEWKYEYKYGRRYGSYAPTMRRLENFLDWPCGRQLFGLAELILYYFFYGFFKLRGVFIWFLYVLASRGFVKDTFRVHRDAKRLLDHACFKSRDCEYYTKSIFEATRRNSSTFIRLIMRWYEDAIWSTNEDGHNFIQYSVINRSEKIYNLLYEMSEHKNIYKTIKDSSGNNLLHLAARLAPTNKLNLIRGAALRIQRELQWFKEVEQFVCPLNRMQKNLDDETPQEVFTKEHKDLVIEGENWIKKTAESYTITAALIITIVFAAAITVPGGNNQDSGIPIFTNKIAFIVFAISNAISLFTAVTSLLMFLSILTARFAEEDFLLKLPTKLIIGLTMLFLSTTAMIIAFGATLFLMFGQSNPSMLIPIGALTCLPITSFVTLQFPLIVDLISATYCGGIFGRKKYGYYFY